MVPSKAVIQSPTHAYVPGKNQRHPENTFDTIRNTVIEGLDPEQLAHCDAFRAGLQYLHDGFYWEAHEVLEPVWMALPEDASHRRLVQGLIQLANGRLKLLMGRPKAALRLVFLARELVPSTAESTLMSLDMHEVHTWIDTLEHDVKGLRASDTQ